MSVNINKINGLSHTTMPQWSSCMIHGVARHSSHCNFITDDSVITDIIKKQICSEGFLTLTSYSVHLEKGLRKFEFTHKFWFDSDFPVFPRTMTKHTFLDLCGAGCVNGPKTITHKCLSMHTHLTTWNKKKIISQI